MDEPKRIDEEVQMMPTALPVTQASLPTAERRQINVLYCTLMMPGGADGPPHNARNHEVCRAAREACAAVVTRFEGHLARQLADSLLVYFGYPRAHENNARQAIRAGFAMLRALQQQYARLGVDHAGAPTVRIGISAGWAIIGGMNATGQRQHIGLSMTPNLAVRLGGLAYPNAVVICATTQQQAQGFFHCEPVPTRFLQQLGTPMSVYRVLRENAAHSPLEARATLGLTPLVGRQPDVNLLLARWQSARTGAGQAVVLSGEAGIGKSRLLQVLQDQVADALPTHLSCRCSPYHQHSMLHPVIDLWQRLLQLQRCESPQEKFHKLETALARYQSPGNKTIPLLAALLSLPCSVDRYPLLSGAPQLQKQQTLQVLVTLLLEMTTHQAVLLVVEDVHWSDPSTLEFLTLLLDQVPMHRRLVLLTHRPGFHLPWSPRAHLTQQTIARLSPQQVEQMLALLTGGKSLPRPIQQQLIARTDGIPLFVEEFTKMLLESDLLLERDHAYEPTGPLPALAIPATLQDSLMARLDRLGTAKAVAQLAATLGRSFSYTLIQAVSPWDETTLQQALDHLVEAEILYVQGASSDLTYLFKHALIQEVAYQALLIHTRQQYHRRIADVLVEHFPDTTAVQPELVAHHYTEAGCSAQAIPYWQRAGAHASSRSACTEAIAHLNKGLQLLATLPDTPENMQRELDIQTMLGPVLMAVRHPLAPEAERAYARARDLCQRVGTTSKLVWAIEGLWTFYLVRGRLDSARELAEQLLSLARQLQTPLSFAIAQQVLGLTLFYHGELSAAHGHLEAGAAHYALQQPHTRALRRVSDAGVLCHAFAALASCLLGYPDQAMLRLQTMLQLAQELAHPYSLAFAHCATAVTHQCRGEALSTQRQAEAAITLATEQGFPLWAAMGTILRGWALALQGQGDSGIAHIRQGLTVWRTAGAENVVPYFLVLMAEAYRATAQVKKGLAALNEALTVLSATGERWWEAETYRLHGEFLLLQTPPAPLQAAASFQRALHIAQQQGARLWELRAATSWNRAATAAHSVAAQQRLQQIYRWFTEGFDLTDLTAARAHITPPLSQEATLTPARLEGEQHPEGKPYGQ